MKSILNQNIKNISIMNFLSVLHNIPKKTFSTQSKISNKIIGIDLGTTNSCVAIAEGASTKVIENNEGMRTLPSFVAFGEDSNHLVEKKYSPSQIAAFILRNLKGVAENYIGETIDKAVITVPAYFNDSQRQATKDAGRIAGLEVKRIINEPTAAAIAYGLEKNQNKKIAVYDLGGGTFDVSILELSDGVFEVKATNGDTALGGEDFDTTIQNFVLEKFKEQHKIDLRNNSIALQRIKEASEKAKIELSSVTSTDIDLPFLYVDKSGPKNFRMKFTREKLESLVKDLLDRSLKPCEVCLKDSGLQKENIQEVLLVGGMTRMPKVVELVKNFFGREPNKSVNPDEAVAIGAAIQGGVLVGEFKDIVLIDVTPLSLGTDSVGDVFVRIINKNSAVPCKKTSSFTTVQDGQTSVRFGIYQGEREIASQNKLLGHLSLEGIPMAPKGIPKIEVTFEIDANGILHVSAMDRGTNRKIATTIQAKSGLNEHQINQMIKEAEIMRQSDLQKKELVTTKNEIDTLIYETDKMLETNKNLISSESFKKLKDLINEIRSQLNTDNLQTLKDLHSKLTTESMEIGKEIYKANSDNSNKK